MFFSLLGLLALGTVPSHLTPSGRRLANRASSRHLGMVSTWNFGTWKGSNVISHWAVELGHELDQERGDLRTPGRGSVVGDGWYALWRRTQDDCPTPGPERRGRIFKWVSRESTHKVDEMAWNAGAGVSAHASWLAWGYSRWSAAWTLRLIWRFRHGP